MILRIQHSIRMVRVSCLVHRDYVDQVLYELGGLGSVELTEIKETPEIENLELTHVARGEGEDRWGSLQSKVNSLITSLKVKASAKTNKEVRLSDLPVLRERMETRTGQIEESVQRIQVEIQSAQVGSRKDQPRRMLRTKNLEIRLAEIAEKAGPDLATFAEILEAERQVEDAKLRMLATTDSLLFQGWVPEDRLEETLATIKKASKGYGDILKIEPVKTQPHESSKEDDPPTLLRYPTFTQVFTIFASLGRAFGMPNYHEIDPTIFFLISFPVIFGMMYGDIGHGLLLLASALTLYRLSRKVKTRPGSITNYALAGSPLLVLCAISSIFFGFLYGEAFGSAQWFTVLTGLNKAPWFSPVDHPTTLLRYSIYVGIAQITLGLLLDLLNKMLAHRYADALAGPVVWLWLYWSGAYLVVIYGFKIFNAIFDPSIVGVWIIPPVLAMIALKLWRHRMMGLNEAFETLLVSFSHSVSYARILALKLVSSSFSALLLPTSLIGIAPFIIGTVALILAFETLLAFLHTLRLHWIEWFSKFYQGSGHPFTPFTITRLVTRFIPE